MAQNQQGAAGGLGQRVAPWRARVASGMLPLSVSPPPPPSIPRRTLMGIAAGSTGGFRSPPPLPARAKPNVDADWEDENVDGVTDVYAERATLVFKRDGIREEETTRELPRPTLRLLPAPPSVAKRSSPPPLPSSRREARDAASPSGFPGTVSLAPPGFDTLSRSLAVASLPPPGFAEALVRANEARTTAPQRTEGLSLRVAAALTAAAVAVLIVFALKPGQGTIVINASDSRGGLVKGLDVFVDGERAACNSAPCSVPAAKGVHEVKVIAEGFEAPATQGVAVASGDSTAIEFTLGSSSESGSKVVGSQEGVTLAVAGKEIPSPTITLAPESTTPPEPPTPTPASTRDPRPAAGLPAHPGPAAPVAKASPVRVGGGGARDAYLNINSLPASTCFLDGRSLGSTPRLRVSVSAGSHTVKFRNSDSGATRTVVVNVGAGETRLAVARLN